MTSTLLKITLQPHSPFMTPLASDTIFGQLCWTIRHSMGEDKLKDLLTGYTEGQPFVVLSDALPLGYIPRPNVPLSKLGYNLEDPTKRKETKSKTWLAFDSNLLTLPLSQWHQYTRSLKDITPLENTELCLQQWQTIVTQPHNSLNRLTNQTGRDGGFSPFSRQATYYHPNALYNIYIVLNEELMDRTVLLNLLQQLGAFGYGKEASSGAGKFSVTDISPVTYNTHQQSNAYLTLGNLAPQGHEWDTKNSFYNTTIRFGRHGAEAVYMGNPFKNPTILSTAGAIFTPKEFNNRLFIGQGLNGLSKIITHTVQQGYTPVLPVYLDKKDN